MAVSTFPFQIWRVQTWPLEKFQIKKLGSGFFKVNKLDSELNFSEKSKMIKLLFGYFTIFEDHWYYVFYFYFL